MKEVTLTTEKVLGAHNIIGQAKYSKLDDGDKIKVWKIARMLKPIADKFREDSQDAAQKMKPSEDFDERWQKAQAFEQMQKANEDMSKAPIGAAEYFEFVREFQSYQRLVDGAVSEFAKKEVTLSIDTLSEDAFGKLLASNDWTMQQVTDIDFIIG